MEALSVIVSYAVVLLAVTALAARLAGRPFVPAPTVQQADGSHDYVPSITLQIFALTSIGIIWVSTYEPPPSWIEMMAIAIASTGWLMLGARFTFGMTSVFAVGLKGGRPILLGALGFLIAGTVLATLGTFN